MQNDRATNTKWALWNKMHCRITHRKLFTICHFLLYAYHLMCILLRSASISRAFLLVIPLPLSLSLNLQRKTNKLTILPKTHMNTHTPEMQSKDETSFFLQIFNTFACCWRRLNKSNTRWLTLEKSKKLILIDVVLCFFFRLPKIFENAV